MNQFESGTSSIVLMFLRAHVRRRVAGAAEEVRGEIDDQIDLPLADFRGVLGLGLPRQRIVVEESAFGAGKQRWAAARMPQSASRDTSRV